MENRESLGDDIFEFVSNCIKKAEELVCGEFEKRLVMKSDRCRMSALIEELTDGWLKSGYRVQRFQFKEGDETGFLVQICREGGDVEKIVTAATGQQMAVCMKMLPQGEDLVIWFGCGKWVDKVFSGVVSWALLPPLLVLPLAGVWRQKSMMENVIHDVLVWFANNPTSTQENENVDCDFSVNDENAEEGELVSLFCRKMAQADWVREAAATDGCGNGVSGSLNFKLRDDVMLCLAFCIVGCSDGYWSSIHAVTEPQWKALMPDIQWDESKKEARRNEFCGRMSEKYQAYMPRGYEFQWQKVVEGGREGFLAMLVHERPEPAGER